MFLDLYSSNVFSEVVINYQVKLMSCILECACEDFVLDSNYFLLQSVLVLGIMHAIFIVP